LTTPARPVVMQAPGEATRIYILRLESASTRPACGLPGWEPLSPSAVSRINAESREPIPASLSPSKRVGMLRARAPQRSAGQTRKKLPPALKPTTAATKASCPWSVGEQENRQTRLNVSPALRFPAEARCGGAKRLAPALIETGSPRIWLFKGAWTRVPPQIAADGLGLELEQQWSFQGARSPPICRTPGKPPSPEFQSTTAT